MPGQQSSLVVQMGYSRKPLFSSDGADKLKHDESIESAVIAVTGQRVAHSNECRTH